METIIQNSILHILKWKKVQRSLEKNTVFFMSRSSSFSGGKKKYFSDSFVTAILRKKEGLGCTINLMKTNI